MDGQARTSNRAGLLTASMALLVFAVGWIDYWTREEVSVSVLYLVSIGLGTGLGFSVARQIVQLRGGTIALGNRTELGGEIQEDLALHDVPIVFLTAMVANRETGGESPESGGQTFVAKPANLDMLVKCIEENTKGVEAGDQN